MNSALIRKFENFTRLSPEDKDLLTRLMAARVRNIDAKADIVAEGARPEVINVVLSGWATRYKVLEDGRRQTMAFFLPGDICDLNVFVLRRMDHAIGALTPVTVAELPLTTYEELMHAFPRIVQAMWWENLVAAAIQREWAMNLGRRDASERMGHLFCELFYRLRAIGQTVGNACELPLTQAELGEATGLSSVHVNRTLQELRAAKLIALRGKVLTILNLEALEKASLFKANYLHLDHEGEHLNANS